MLELPLRLYHLALLSGSLCPGIAAAHAILIDSTPAPLAHVAAGHLGVAFRYNSRIDAGRSRLTLLRPGGAADRLAVDAAGPPDLLKTDLDLSAGDYVLTWQVLAVDGHITRGRVPFTVDPPGAGVAAK